MKHLLFSTGNTQKVAMGTTVCKEYGVKLVQKDLAVDEVQSEDSEYVAKKKAEAAFALAKEPVIISDDSWALLGLNGFPGTYAKSVNTWFKPEDYLRLLQSIDNRSSLFTQILVYQDENQQKLFKNETIGTALHTARGKSGSTIQKIISFEPDGRTIAEKLDDGSYFSGATTLDVWHDFAKWFTQEHNT